MFKELYSRFNCVDTETTRLDFASLLLKNALFDTKLDLKWPICSGEAMNIYFTMLLIYIFYAIQMASVGI